MFLKKFLLFGLIAAVLPAVAEEAADRKTATSLKYVEHELDTRQNKFGADTNKAMEYTSSAGTVQKRTVKSDLGSDTSDTSLPMVGGVNTKLNQKQDDIDPVNDHTAVTYTGTAGGIGQKGIYQTTESYAEQSDNLIDAKTFNAAIKNGLDSEFICSEFKPDTNLCWVYSIHNATENNTILPVGYIPLEYIRSDGTQYIDTEIYWHSGYSIKMDFTSGEARGNYALFGAGNGVAYNHGEVAVFWFGHIFHSVIPTGNSSGEYHAFGDYLANTRYTLTYNDTKTTATQGSVSKYASNTGFYDSYVGVRPITLFAVNRSGGVLYNGAFSIHSVRIYDDNNTMVRNFIPARHDTAVGLYDTVSQRFFPSLPSGTNFAAGPAVVANIYIPQNQ